MKLPMRFRIIHLMATNEKLSNLEVMEALRAEYGTEGQFKFSIIDTHLKSMRAVGIVEAAEVALSAEGKLLEIYKITDYGRSLLKYLPKDWKKEA